MSGTGDVSELSQAKDSRASVDALKVWADTALQEARSRPSWREGLSVGEAAGLAGDVLALLEHIRQLETALRAMREVASVSYSGDPWYAEQEGLDVPHAFAQARIALQETEVGSGTAACSGGDA